MRILIAEDDVVFRRILEATLLKWGYEVICARDGDEAWQLMQSSNSPRLVILDWMMPGLDGPEICRRVRQQSNKPYTYILLLSAKGHRGDMITGLESGADDYITKPFDPLELRGRLRAGHRIVELQEELLAAREELRYMATHDFLTRLWNRSAIIGTLQKKLSQVVRNGKSVSVAMADVDHFKDINDTYGHSIGDEVLCEIARRMTASIRIYDEVGRYGGEEFLVVFDGCKGPDAHHLAERLRRCVSDQELSAGGVSIPATISIGVAVAEAGGKENHEGIIHRADAALYIAKNNGRNRVVFAPFSDTDSIPAFAARP